MASSGFFSGQSSSAAQAKNLSSNKLALTLQRLSENEMNGLLAALCNGCNEGNKWEKLAHELSKKARRLNSDEMINLIKRDNKTPLECVHAFLRILQKDYIEITPELFADSLDEILLQVSAKNVRNKMKLAASPESLPVHQRIQPVSTSLHYPLKELFHRFSKEEMERLIDALSLSHNWKHLAEKLQYKTQKSDLVYQKVVLIGYDNNTPEQCANAFLVFLQNECPAITPAIFIDGLNQILLKKTAEMVQEKMKSVASFDIQHVSPRRP